VRVVDLRCFRVSGARYATTAELVTEQPAVLWRAFPARAVVAIAPLWFTIAVLVLGAPLSMKLAVGAMLAVSIASPYAGLLAVAATVPLADYIGIILNLGSYRLGEAVTIAFLSGWLIRGEPGRPGPRVAGGIGWALAVAIVASMVGTAVRFPGALREAANWAFYGYYLSVDPSGWVDGARLLEGIALVAAVFAMFRRRPQLAVALPAALTIAATAAGATSILLWYRVAPAVILQRHALIGYRYTAHVADVNAAGSYFALSVCLALAMAVRARGRSQVTWLVATAVCVVAAWLAASRTANAAAIVASAVPRCGGLLPTGRKPQKRCWRQQQRSSLSALVSTSSASWHTIPITTALIFDASSTQQVCEWSPRRRFRELASDNTNRHRRFSWLRRSPTVMVRKTRTTISCSSPPNSASPVLPFSSAG
jgi:hypothetical protein